MKDNINKRILCDDKKCKDSVVPRNKWCCPHGHIPSEKAADHQQFQKIASEHEGSGQGKQHYINVTPPVLPTPEAAHDKAFQSTPKKVA
jgi:hypothetical protein